MYRIGIDLGGTNIAVGLVNEQYEIVKKESTPTKVGRPSEEIVKDMAELCKKVCAEQGISLDDVASIGVVSPGVVDDKLGEAVFSGNLGFRHFPLVPVLKGFLPGKEIHIENDANAAAWGEAVAGAAKGSSSSVMVTLGTGVGGGIVENGKILKGYNDGAGELGHTVIVVDGAPCTCGRRGCWEAYSSATALIRMTKQKIAECESVHKTTAMTEIAQKMGKINGRTAFEAMRAGDEAGTEVVKEYSKYLAAGITNIINCYQPEILSIGGGVSNEGQFLLDQIKDTVANEVFGKGVEKKTEIRIAQLKNDAGIIGAALLGVEF